MGGGLRRLEEEDKLDLGLIADIYTFDLWLMVLADGLAHPAMPFTGADFGPGLLPSSYSEAVYKAKERTKQEPTSISSLSNGLNKGQSEENLLVREDRNKVVFKWSWAPVSVIATTFNLSSSVIGVNDRPGTMMIKGGPVDTTTMGSRPMKVHYAPIQTPLRMLPTFPLLKGRNTHRANLVFGIQLSRGINQGRRLHHREHQVRSRSWTHTVPGVQ
ncbi:hypothetical protein B0H14DRAFT_3144365, partial [Mycena olivaceomarginata]